tara:strand:+ start:186 stop:803 length:618 start_codon:yes stop_codon:yes gene_type:complete
MSKDSSAGGGASVGFQELLRTNPELLEEMVQGGMPAATQQQQQPQQQNPVMVRDMSTPDAIASFYGPSDQIVQPDQSYFQDFAQPDQDYYQQFVLPGVQMDRPETAAESEDREAARQKEEERARYAPGGSMSRTAPADEAPMRQQMFRQGGLLGLPQQMVRDMAQSRAEEDGRMAPSMPILDFAGGNTAYMGVPDFRNFNMRGMR